MRASQYLVARSIPCWINRSAWLLAVSCNNSTASLRFLLKASNNGTCSVAEEAAALNGRSLLLPTLCFLDRLNDSSFAILSQSSSLHRVRFSLLSIPNAANDSAMHSLRALTGLYWPFPARTLFREKTFLLPL
jgi:hypothetical protein